MDEMVARVASRSGLSIAFVKKGDKWLFRTQYASGEKHEWQIEEDGDKHSLTVITPKGTFKHKKGFKGVDKAERYAEKFILVANGHELLEDALKKDFERATKTANELGMIMRVAGTRRAEDEESAPDDDDGEWSKDQKRGEWNLILSKSRPTRWDYFLKNPKGGGGGSTSYTSASRAMGAAGVSRVKDRMGKDRVWVIEQVWDGDKYVVKKSYWKDFDDFGKTAAGAFARDPVYATWADAEAVIKAAARKYKLEVADKGRTLILTNKESGDYGVFEYNNNSVDAAVFEQDSRTPYAKGSVLLSSFKDEDDWKESLGFFAQSVSI